MEKPGIQCYRDLEVWKLGIDLVESVYLLGKKLPKTENFGLVSQIQRAAVSVPANIAEGHSRRSSREFMQFISIALGSLAELETHFYIINRLKYLETNETDTVFAKTDQLGRMLRGLQAKLKEKVRV
jgi:four helix bundle protein